MISGARTFSGGGDSSVGSVVCCIKQIGKKSLIAFLLTNGFLFAEKMNSLLWLDSYKHMGLNVKGVECKSAFFIRELKKCF